MSRPVREPGEVQELEEAPESGYIQGFEEALESGEVQEFEEVQEEPGVTEEDALISERNLVLDLGCGTGTITELLYEKGYDMIGVDSSEEMLQIALDKKFETGSDILYLCQDMRELDLYSTVGTVVSVCDSLNYLLMDEDVKKGEYLGCHPCINTSSLKLYTKDVLEKFLPAVRHEPVYVVLNGD